MKALAVLGVMASPAVSGVALAAPPICKGGLLADAVTGRPILGANRQPIECDPPQAESSLDPTAASIFALAALGGATGLAVGIHGSNQPTPSFFIPAGQPASP